MRYIIRLSYNGAPYCGWQIQPDATTVQGEVERCLSTLLGTDIRVTGAGRTDSGVNAVNYILHFDTEGELLLEPERLACKLNAILPVSIAVHELVPAPEIPRPADGSFSQDWHARFSAVSRERPLRRGMVMVVQISARHGQDERSLRQPARHPRFQLL